MNELLGDELVSAIRGPSFAHLSDKIRFPLWYWWWKTIFFMQWLLRIADLHISLVIFLVEKRVKNGFTKIGIIAATIEFAYVSEKMSLVNPMIAYSWLLL